MAITDTTPPKSSRNRNVSRIPFQSPVPKNCAPKMEAPDSPPKMVRL